MFKYSIIIPVYNSEKTINRCIKSIVEQNYKNFELILVDDGSTDNTYEILKSYQRNNDKIVVLHKENGGPGKARNLGLQHCTGDYIIFVDSDDYIEKDYLKKINNKLKESDSDIVFISSVMETDNGTINKYIKTGKFSKYTKKELLDLEIMGILPWGPCSKVVSKRIIDGCFFSDLDVGEEIIYSFSIINRAKKIEFLDDILYHYIYNDNGQHKKGGIDPWYLVVKKMKNYLINISEYESHILAVNGLALKSLAISIYRCSINYKYKKALKSIKLQIKKYKSEYDIGNVNKKYIDFSTKLILQFIKLRLLSLLFLASNIKNKIKNRRN